MLPPTVAVYAIFDPSGEKYGSVSTLGVDVSRRAWPPVRGDDPEIAGVLERDEIPAHRRMAQQPRALRGRRCAAPNRQRRSEQTAVDEFTD